LYLPSNTTSTKAFYNEIKFKVGFWSGTGLKNSFENWGWTRNVKLFKHALNAKGGK
jgi:hypothetical protein